MASAGSKRPRTDTAPSHAFSDLSAPPLAFLGRSEVMLTGMEGAGRATLADAVAVLPFSSEEVANYLAPLVEAEESAPPFLLSAGNCSSLLFLSPMYPALRALSIGDAARWLEDDLVQRYAENPSAEGSWRTALTVAGCPACDTLWELVSKKYTALRKQWDGGAPAPATFGAVPTAEQVGARSAWKRGISMGALSAMLCVKDDSLKLFGICFAPTILATLHTPLRAL